MGDGDGGRGRGKGPERSHLRRLNPAQREAATNGLERPRTAPPLLVIAGAGNGKTRVLAHRVAELVLRGVDPHRLLLLTFTRRAAREMARRAERIVADAVRDAGGGRGVAAAVGALRWAGTFHAVANRLLRHFAPLVGLEPSFTILDRGDSEDLLDVLRGDRGLPDRERRFPRKATCLAIYSRVVNARQSLSECLERHYPWCAEWEAELRGLFRDYVDAKQEHQLLDYDDLLLYWFHLMQEEALAQRVAALFDHVLVDEYQDTNALQAAILLALRPSGDGITVVGDDAQAIYGFRAATVRNILEFPRCFDPPARVVKLERNYRSTQPVLDAANAVIGEARERYRKELRGARPSEQRPLLVEVEDEADQARYVTDQVLRVRESGVPLKRQAVLFRTAHHSDLLEVELGRRNIPFVKYGGLRFLEAGHVKDFLAVLRWAQNPRDRVAGFRVLQLLPGVGPAHAAAALDAVEAAGWRIEALGEHEPPAAAAPEWRRLASLLEGLAAGEDGWPAEIGPVRAWYGRQLQRLYESAAVREGDLEQLEGLAGEYPSRERFLTELTLDPPAASGDHAGPPHLDEDYLVLSTIHSAKGQEWDAVYVLNVVDGCIPSDMATGDEEEIEEERRLLYVAMTRARDELHLMQPLRFFVIHQPRHGDRHVYAPLSRFMPPSMRDRLERVSWNRMGGAGDAASDDGPRVDVGGRLRDMW